MPHYYSLGPVPPKRHTQFTKPNGGLYSEQLFSTEGFSNNYSLLYHIHPPTKIVRSEEPTDITPVIASDNILKHRSFLGFNIKQQETYLDSRKPVLVNSDCHISLASPKKGLSGHTFFKNADADEVLFIHEGEGEVITPYGKLPFAYGDYIVIPRGTIYQIEFKTENNRLLIIESFGPIRFPKRYKSSEGQLMEHSPYCERDIKKPIYFEPIDQEGEFLILTKKKNLLYPITYGTHPFDVIAWDGCEYPYIFSIHNFEPITGRVHQPPPVHQTFDGKDFVICSFVPRLYDYHPQAIPAPYNHSNIDSDEVLYYVDGEFMSRKHVERGMITLHPSGIPHGPHPGAVAKSIGKTATKELAVMIDTFRPLHMTNYAKEIEDDQYEMSWAE
jgi:homogentisate 1,2-dioxygenase